MADLRAVERMQGTLIVATGEDPGAFDLRPQAVMRSGVRILRLLACGATSTALDGAPIALSLQQRWAGATGERGAVRRGDGAVRRSRA
ncbi:MAG: hypothetical protein R2856_22620 [Caldilineaceae bacterium]